MKLSSLNITNFKIDGGSMFGAVPRSVWQGLYPADIATNLCPWALRSLIVEDDGRVILIDTGFGDKQSPEFFDAFQLFGGEDLLLGLRQKGYCPEDITDVVITHLHYDHCGGSIGLDRQTGNYVAVFPNATIHVSAAQWEWALHPNGFESDSFLPENILPMRDLGLLHLIEGPQRLTSNVELRLFNGHTRGQILPLVHHPKGTLAFVADLFPSTAHIPLPCIMGYDGEPLVTFEEKKSFLAESFANGYTYFFQHDFYNECCSIDQTADGFCIDEIFDLRHFLF